MNGGIEYPVSSVAVREPLHAVLKELSLAVGSQSVHCLIVRGHYEVADHNSVLSDSSTAFDKARHFLLDCPLVVVAGDEVIVVL